MDDRRVVLITGASSGIGRAIADLLSRQGYRVFGTSRRPAPDARFDFEMLELDVTSDESASRCVNAVLERAGRLDVLINNAGMSVSGAIEEIELDTARELFETNFFGAVRMVKAALPHMRAQGRGHIINISSALGQMGMPFEAYYSASKHALEAFSEALWHEVRPFNIRVSVVGPGFMRSNLRQAARRAAIRLPAYDAARRQIEAEFDRRVENGADPAIVARAVLRLLRSDAPPFRTPVGLEAVVVAVTRPVTPPGLFAKGVRWVMGLDDWRRDALRIAPAAGAGLALLALFARWRSRQG